MLFIQYILNIHILDCLYIIIIYDVQNLIIPSIILNSTFHLKQISLSNKKSPLIPPDIMLDNYSIEYSPHIPSDTRFKYQSLIKTNNTNFRKYLTGSKYKNLYSNTYNVIDDPDFNMIVQCDVNTTTIVKAKTLSKEHELVRKVKSFCINNFKNVTRGNCRIKSGDGGIMNVIGMNRKKKKGTKLTNS